MRIGVCIPCHKLYIPYLQNCLESIEYQTRKPDIVSISFSEVEVAPELCTYSFPIEVSISLERQCQGKNRNIASSKIDVDILTFFDADDIMHPKRLQCIESAFQTGIDGFLHNNKPCASSQYRTRFLSQNLWESIDNNCYTDGFISSKDVICGRVESKYGNLTNGHFSCKYSIWRDIHYPEEYGIGEDSEYVYQIYEKGYKLGYSPDKLSYYIRDDFPPGTESKIQVIPLGYHWSPLNLNYHPLKRTPNLPFREIHWSFYE
jgi:cellulose synthase/poly-beta-1,6-N-acetylglucosamine synthase-like glycosyltransferase